MIGDTLGYGAKIRQHWLQQWRVEGVRDGERLGADALCCELCGNRMHRFCPPGDDHADWAVHRCDGDVFHIRRDGVPHLRLVSRDGDHRPIRRQFPHQPPARRHQLQPICQAEHPGQTRRDQLARAMPDQDSWLHAPRLPQLSQGIFQRKQRGLGIGRLVNYRRIVEDVAQWATQQWIKHRGAGVQCLAEGRFGRVQF